MADRSRREKQSTDKFADYRRARAGGKRVLKVSVTLGL